MNTVHHKIFEFFLLLNYIKISKNQIKLAKIFEKIKIAKTNFL